MNNIYKKLHNACNTASSVKKASKVKGMHFNPLLHDNVLRVFPVPGSDGTTSGSSAGTMWVEFMLKSDRSSASIVEASDKIKYVSGVPYKNPTYKEINSVGRSWIFEFTLAICKEMLGYVRGKYETIPIPNAEITLNQGDLIASATKDKEALLASLRAFFDETSREKLLERRTMESNFVMEELDRVPRVIYIG